MLVQLANSELCNRSEQVLGRFVIMGRNMQGGLKDNNNKKKHIQMQITYLTIRNIIIL